ncbi:hypothetical protein P8452_64620 [Trifolium repens]|nr:hypothetical protein P8452_64620 [Trifolium repens]
MKEEKHFKLLWGGVLTMVKCCLDIVIEMKGEIHELVMGMFDVTTCLIDSIAIDFIAISEALSENGVAMKLNKFLPQKLKSLTKSNLVASDNFPFSSHIFSHTFNLHTNPKVQATFVSGYQHRSLFFLYALPALSQENKQSSKRLLFDRRYGWVIDEWKQPAEEALEGGRGMFCILPLAKSLAQMASQSINLGVSSAIKAAENPPTFSMQMLQSALDDGVRKCKDSEFMPRAFISLDEFSTPHKPDCVAIPWCYKSRKRTPTRGWTLKLRRWLEFPTTT